MKGWQQYGELYWREAAALGLSLTGFLATVLDGAADGMVVGRAAMGLKGVCALSGTAVLGVLFGSLGHDSGHPKKRGTPSAHQGEPGKEQAGQAESRPNTESAWKAAIPAAAAPRRRLTNSRRLWSREEGFTLAGPIKLNCAGRPRY